MCDGGAGISAATVAAATAFVTFSLSTTRAAAAVTAAILTATNLTATSADATSILTATIITFAIVSTALSAAAAALVAGYSRSRHRRHLGEHWRVPALLGARSGRREDAGRLESAAHRPPVLQPDRRQLRPISGHQRRRWLLGWLQRRR